MKILIILLQLLCYQSQIEGLQQEHNEIKGTEPENFSFIEDIDYAKMNVTLVMYTATKMSENQLHAYDFINGWEQKSIFKLYRRLLDFEVNEEEIKSARSLIDANTIFLSQDFSSALQNPRDLIAASGITEFHLDNLILDYLSEHFISIGNAQSKLSLSVLELENKMKSFEQNLKKIIDPLTESLDETQLSEINTILEDMRNMTDGYIAMLETDRNLINENTSTALEALQVVIDQMKQ